MCVYNVLTVTGFQIDRIRRMKGTSTKDEHTSADYIHERSAKKKEVRFALQYKDGQIVQPEIMDENGENEKQERVEVDSDDSSDGSEGDESSEEQDDSEDPAEMYGSDLESGDEEQLNSDSKLPEQQTLKKHNLSGPSQVEVAQSKDAASQELPYTFQS